MVNIENRSKGPEKRLALLEQGRSLPPVLEMDLILPEADIDGLHFNETKVHAIFKQQDDGWYHSRDILFLSARNAEDDNSRDILTEYLNGGGERGIKAQIAMAAGLPPEGVTVALSKEPRGSKRYNGVDCWYWLNDSYSGSADAFCYANYYGQAYFDDASAVGGCAPVFRIVKIGGLI
jgi:hypothetical protein